MAYVRKLSKESDRTFATEMPAGLNTPQALLGFARRNHIQTRPLDIERLADALGLTVLYESMDKSISGYLEKLRQGWVIGVRAYEHPTRQRFTIAHELAHYVLHRDERVKFEDEPFGRRTDNTDPMEQETDKFAANLLMPESEFKAAVSNGIDTLSKLSERFGTSMMAVRYRAKQLGLIRRSG